MPQSRVKTQKGGHYEVQVSLSRRDVIDLVLARRRLREYMAQGFLTTGEDMLRSEYILSVLNGLIARVDKEIRDGGFTWNIEAEYDAEA